MTQDILKAYGPIGVDMLKMNLQKVSATGKTVDSVRSEVEIDRLKLLARGYLPAIETGRGPREAGTYGEFDKGLDEWMSVKGFESKTSKTGNKYFKIGDSWVSAKSLAYKINTVGDKLWRQGHGEIVRDVYSLALAKFVEELSAAVVKDKAEQFQKQVMAVWH